MADPTLKDVMKVLAEIQRTMATKAALEALDEKTEERFDALDAKVEVVRDVLVSSRADIRDIEKDVATLKKSVAAVKGRPAPRAPRRR